MRQMLRAADLPYIVIRRTRSVLAAVLDGATCAMRLVTMNTDGLSNLLLRIFSPIMLFFSPPIFLWLGYLTYRDYKDGVPLDIRTIIIAEGILLVGIFLGFFGCRHFFGWFQRKK